MRVLLSIPLPTARLRARRARTPRFGALLAALAASLPAGCLAPAPAERAPSTLGVVRADDRALAAHVSARIAELAPRVEALLPDASLEKVDVWIQEEPELYAFPLPFPFAATSYAEADGFWAERPGRIHLRREAQDLERTLVHELVHAALGESWRALPGTLEEGLCDVVAVQLSDSGAESMRAGRLSAACFALGGLEFDLEVQLDLDDEWSGERSGEPGDEFAAPRRAARLSYVARILLQNEKATLTDPRRVFDVRAGLSSTRMESANKRAFYGLGFAVVQRIVERRGIEGLHRLCVEALAEGRPEVPIERLLAAAELPADREGWRRALLEDLTRRDLAELVGMYPAFLSDALTGCLDSFPELVSPSPRGSSSITLRLVGTEVALPLRALAPR